MAVCHDTNYTHQLMQLLIMDGKMCLDYYA